MKANSRFVAYTVGLACSGFGHKTEMLTMINATRREVKGSPKLLKFNPERNIDV